MDYTRVQDAFPVLSTVPRHKQKLNVATKNRRQQTLPFTNTSPGSPLTSKKVREGRNKQGPQVSAPGVQVSGKPDGDGDDEIEEASVDDQSQSSHDALLKDFTELQEMLHAQGDIIAKLRARIDTFETRVSRIDEVQGEVAKLEDKVQKLEEGGNVLSDLKRTGGVIVQDAEKKLEEIKERTETYFDTVTTEIHAKANQTMRKALEEASGSVDVAVKTMLDEKIQFIADSLNNHDFSEIAEQVMNVAKEVMDGVVTERVNAITDAVKRRIDASLFVAHTTNSILKKVEDNLKQQEDILKTDMSHRILQQIGSYIAYQTDTEKYKDRLVESFSHKYGVMIRMFLEGYKTDAEKDVKKWEDSMRRKMDEFIREQKGHSHDKIIKEQQARMRSNVSVPIPEIEPDGSVAPPSEHGAPESESGSNLHELYDQLQNLTQNVIENTATIAALSEWKEGAEEKQDININDTGPCIRPRASHGTWP
eukprot:763966-Hanusia_phi.AAC.1